MKRWGWLLALVVGIAVGRQLPETMARADGANASPFANLGIFARALAHIENAYVDPVDQDALVHGAIRGMVSALDPHSTYLDPEEYRILTSDTRGRFAGIGVEIAPRDGWLTVLGVFEHGPAAEAGIRPGDRFLTIEGRDARDLRIQDAVRLMRGEPGTSVRVALRRPGREEALELTMVRAFIEVNPVEASLLSDGVLYLRLKAFQGNTFDEMQSAIETAQREHGSELRGIVLDLRNNPGGLLHQSVEVVDAFIEDGIIVSTRGRGGEMLSESRARRRGTWPRWPMVTLINGYSASAAEIVAGALQDHERSLIMGTRSWGKGSVQNVIELPDASALKLTIARYYTPSGRSIQAQGIEPDLPVEQVPPGVLRQARRDAANRFNEASLSNHLRAEDADADAAAEPEDGAGRDAIRDEAAEDGAPFADDHQVQMALQTLRAMEFAQQEQP